LPIPPGGVQKNRLSRKAPEQKEERGTEGRPWVPSATKGAQKKRGEKKGRTHGHSCPGTGRKLKEERKGDGQSLQEDETGTREDVKGRDHSMRKRSKKKQERKVRDYEKKVNGYPGWKKKLPNNFT